MINFITYYIFLSWPSQTQALSNSHAKEPKFGSQKGIPIELEAASYFYCVQSIPDRPIIDRERT